MTKVIRPLLKAYRVTATFPKREYHVGPDWAYNIVKMVGNYSQVYEKYMGTGGPEAIGIPREGSANALWTQGGLMYSPPFR